MIWMKTTDNQYIIEFERKPCRIPNKDFRYICKMRFKNIFGMLLRELTFHENHIVIMLSLLYEYIEFGSTNLSASFDTDYNMDLDSICIIKNYIPDPKDPKRQIAQDILLFEKYNTVSEKIITIIRIELDFDDLIIFCRCLYEEFVKDLEDGIYYNIDFLL